MSNVLKFEPKASVKALRQLIELGFIEVLPKKDDGENDLIFKLTDKGLDHMAQEIEKGQG